MSLARDLSVSAVTAGFVTVLVGFLVTASGVTLSGVGSAFWGLVAGVVTVLILRAGGRRG